MDLVGLLIDGNNLMHALRKAGADAGRGMLCRLLGDLPAGRERVCVVFDGPPPSRDLAGQLSGDRIEVHYSGPRKADEIIAEEIAADSAPRRLTVVSTDRQVRRQARRRRCRVRLSEEFAELLLRGRPARPPAAEPPEKRRGLTPEQTEAWMRELQLDNVETRPTEDGP